MIHPKLYPKLAQLNRVKLTPLSNPMKVLLQNRYNSLPSFPDFLMLNSIMFVYMVFVICSSPMFEIIIKYQSKGK